MSLLLCESVGEEGLTGLTFFLGLIFVAVGG